MFKNVASQKLIVFAFDSTSNAPKTGDAANITAYVSKDYGSVTVLGDTSATEMDSTNAKGYYLFDLTQSETNADTLLFSAKSSTANVVVIGVPATVFTVPPNFTKQAIDSSLGGVLLSDGVAHGGTLGSSTATFALSRFNITSQTSNTTALTIAGNGTGNGLQSTGGATGIGAKFVGGATSGVGVSVTTTSGDGISVTPTAGHALTLTANGTVKHGVNATGSAGATTNAAGHGISATGGAATTSSGGTAGVGFKATGGAGAASTNGAGEGVTFVGGGTTTVSGANGFSSTGTGNLSGVSLVGAGSGNGMLLTKGSTGDGFKTDTFRASSDVTLVGSVTVGGSVEVVGSVAIDSNLTITGVTTHTGAFLATNASNDIRGVALTAAYDFAKGTVAMTESYAADGAAPTPVQALFAIQQFQQEKSVSSTTMTVKKLDGSTTAMTLTLDSSTSPTSITRAT